ncbi:unnamed protein product [Paramecium sonneborni]|uniref:Uncharacterized protein n=1 Tax=Paramecium sonneborni TaxID=65129 RepID=A0A8S1MBV0_9CILI|nr:unnamed protein product [Paramecium sonneborni]
MNINYPQNILNFTPFQKLSREIQKAMKGLPVFVCPFCNLMQTNDSYFNHVRCFDCNRDLCSACSVDRAPIIAHGNHYHRIGCSDYQPLYLKVNKLIKKNMIGKNVKDVKKHQSHVNTQQVQKNIKNKETFDDQIFSLNDSDYIIQLH